MLLMLTSRAVRDVNWPNEDGRDPTKLEDPIPIDTTDPPLQMTPVQLDVAPEHMGDVTGTIPMHSHDE